MSTIKTRIYIDPKSKISYSSYYLQGMYHLFGRKNISFSNKYFTTLRKENDPYSYDAYMALVIVQNGNQSKVIIDFGDDFPIRINAYEWCDVYAKINYNSYKTSEEFKSKILSIPPGFGIKIWNIFEAISFSFLNLIQVKFKPQISLTSHFRSYLGQLRAFRLKNFIKNEEGDSSDKKYIFFISSLWPHPNCITGTNVYRKMFIESCLKNKVAFEGGFFVTDKNHPQFEEFKNLIFSRRYPLSEYIEKTKESILVFNTPSVHNCHGWKLGQFLAMNKAIISTPFHNSLPEDLVNGENIHFVSDETQLDDAILKILQNDTYRKKLETGAKAYFQKQASPEAVIQQIFQKLKLNLN